MNEIGKILEKNEKFEWDDKPKYSAYITSVLIGVIILAGIGTAAIMFMKLSLLWFIALAALCLISLIIGQLNYNVTHYAITSKRVIIQTGIIGRDFKSIEYDKIQNASVNVGLLGLIFKVGTIQIFTGEMESYSTGTGQNRTTGMKSKYDTLKYIPDQYTVLKHLQEHLSERKENLYAGRT